MAVWSPGKVQNHIAMTGERTNRRTLSRIVPQQQTILTSAQIRNDYGHQTIGK